MTNYEFSKLAILSNKAVDTIEEIFDELCRSETERKIYKDLLTALIRNERLSAALEMMDQMTYNKDCN